MYREVACTHDRIGSLSACVATTMSLPVPVIAQRIHIPTPKLVRPALPEGQGLGANCSDTRYAPSEQLDVAQAQVQLTHCWHHWVSHRSPGQDRTQFRDRHKPLPDVGEMKPRLRR